jgi:hypothetical protein
MVGSPASSRGRRVVSPCVGEGSSLALQHRHAVGQVLTKHSIECATGRQNDIAWIISMVIWLFDAVEQWAGHDRDTSVVLADVGMAIDAVLEEVLDVIYLTPHQAMAVRAVESYAPLLQAARLKIMGWWAGWASTLRNEPFLTGLFEQLKAPRRFRVAA